MVNAEHMELELHKREWYTIDTHNSSHTMQKAPVIHQDTGVVNSFWHGISCYGRHRRAGRLFQKFGRGRTSRMIRLLGLPLSRRRQGVKSPWGRHLLAPVYCRGLFTYAPLPYLESCLSFRFRRQRPCLDRAGPR